MSHLHSLWVTTSLSVFFSMHFEVPNILLLFKKLAAKNVDQLIKKTNNKK